MIVMLEISPESRAVLAGFSGLAGRVDELCRAGLSAAAHAGADHVGELLLTGQLALKPGRAGLGGIAGQVSAWKIDDDTMAVGVPSQAPASAYAGIQETGGTIHAKPGGALAVPLTAQARNFTSPRDVPDLVLIKRSPGKPPLLAQVMGDSIIPWYVLLKSVTLKPTRWLSDGVTRSMETMTAAFQNVLDRETT